MTDRRGRGRPRETDTDTDTSAAISRAALTRFAAQGFEATSLREIAADAGVDVALISYRFGGKQGIWKAIVVQAAQDLSAALDTAAADTEGADTEGADTKRAGAQTRLHQSARAFIAFLLARPEVPQLLLRDITVDSERSAWLLDTLSLPLHHHFIELAEAAAAEGEGARAHLQFRVANFIYSAASTVARRERLAKLVDGIGSDAEFAAALEQTLVEGALLP